MLPLASLDHNDFVWRGNTQTVAVDAEDLAFRVFLAWHAASQRIYIGIERIDDVYVALEEGFAGNGDTTFMIDGDHSGGQYWFFEQEGYSEEESKRLFSAQAQTYTAAPEQIDGQLLHISSWATWAQEPPWL